MKEESRLPGGGDGKIMENKQRRLRTRRSITIPPELEDPEDCTIGEAEADDIIYEEEYDEVFETKGTSISSKSQQISWKEWLSTQPKEARNLLAGGIAGMAAKSVVAPLDRIKILFQVSSAEFHIKSLPNVIKNIINNEGLSALWKGNTATMIRVFPYSGIQFMVFDRIKTHLLHEHEKGRYITFNNNDNNSKTQKPKWGLTPIESLTAGMTAGTISVIATYPLDLTRAQLAVLKKHKYDTATKKFTTVLTENFTHGGISGLFRGITPTLLGILPYSGIAFTLNEQGKRKVGNRRQLISLWNNIKLVNIKSL